MLTFKIIILGVYIIAISLAVNELLFWIYLIQLKEYRLDRLKDFFSSNQGKGIIQKRFFIVVFLLAMIAAYLLNDVLIDSSDAPSWQKIIPLFGLFLFTVIQLFSFIQKIRRRQLKFPKVTFRISVIIANSIATYAGVVVLFLPISLQYSEALMVLYYLIAPFVALCATALSWPLAQILKKKIISNATKKRESFQNLTVIGITGSYGKTSVKEYTYEILKRRFNTLKTEEHINSEMGVAQTIISYLEPKHEVFVVEMGAYRRGEIKMLAEMAQPQIGVLTGINEQHLSLFGGIQNTIKAKSELVYALPKRNGVAIINGDNKYTKSVAEKLSITTLQYSLAHKKDLYLGKQEIVDGKTNFTINYREKEREFTTSLIGSHNIQNLLAAILVGFKMGLSYQEIKKAVASIKPIEKNLQVKNIKNNTIIDNTYNLNPDSFSAAIDLIEQLPKAKNVLIMDDVLELGEKGEQIHKRIGKKIGPHFDMLIYIGDMYHDEVSNAAKLSNSRIKLIHSTDENYQKIFKASKKKKNIFVMGRSGQKIIKKYT